MNNRYFLYYARRYKLIRTLFPVLFLSYNVLKERERKVWREEKSEREPLTVAIFMFDLKYSDECIWKKSAVFDMMLYNFPGYILPVPLDVLPPYDILIISFWGYNKPIGFSKIILPLKSFNLFNLLLCK